MRALLLDAWVEAGRRNHAPCAQCWRSSSSDLDMAAIAAFVSMAGWRLEGFTREGLGRLRDTEMQLAKTQEALVDTRHELSKSKAAGQEWRKQQRLAALDLDNYRRYIKTAREKEKHFKAEMAQVNKRQVALALELAKKDDSAIELKRRIDELSKVAEETFQQQQAMQHQVCWSPVVSCGRLSCWSPVVSCPAPPTTPLLPRSSAPSAAQHL